MPDTERLTLWLVLAELWPYIVAAVLIVIPVAFTLRHLFRDKKRLAERKRLEARAELAKYDDGDARR